MKKKSTLCLLAMLAACALPASATQGAPHSLKAVTQFDNVTLSWEAPAAAKELRWHDKNDYNGDHLPQTDPQKLAVAYMGARFTADDLKASVGEKIQSIAFFQYRQVVSSEVIVYENGVAVASAMADPARYAKNTWLTVNLPEAVTIKADAEYIFAVKFSYGNNVDFVCIKDASADFSGKGDLLSSDGKNWKATANGEYLVTAILENSADETPVGYKVYDNDEPLTTTPVTETTFSATALAPGTHKLKVSAVYDNDAEVASPALEVVAAPFSSFGPSANIATPTVSGLNVSLAWTAPLTGGSSLTWGQAGTMSQSIGGTASSNTKVWIRNAFDSGDLMAFANGEITAINTVFAEEVISGITLWIMDNGVMVYSQAVTAEQIATIKAGEWFKMTLDTPYKILAGHDVSYGLYVLHTPKTHPIAVDASTAVNVKGNSFSTSSCNAINFLNSKPSWKTLASGGIPGNWMMTADITGGQTLTGAVTYTLTRNGEPVATKTSETSFVDAVPEPGFYSYALTAYTGDKPAAEAVSTSVTVKLPDAYAAPLVTDAEWNEETSKFAMEWSTDKELSHYGTPTYMVGFDEGMTMMWGAQFKAADLAAYKDMVVKSLKFAIADAVQGLKVGIYTPTGTALYEADLSSQTIEPLSFYTLPLTTPIEITGDQDLILAYSGTMAGGTSPILLDAGPLADGGARVSLTGGTSWMNLGTINSTYNNYNIVISAIVGDKDNTQSATPLTASPISRQLVATQAKVENRSFGVAPAAEVVTATANAPAAPRVASFNVYKNGEIVANTTSKTYAEDITSFGSFSYHVTAVYTNGWESAASQSIKFKKTVAQKTVAPYGLTASTMGNDLTLNWQSPENAITLNYIKGTTRNGLGTTGSNPETYCLIKLLADDLAAHVGKRIDHIVFGLIDRNVKTLEVVIGVNENIIYSQTVDVSTLVVGDNDVRLNVPYEITPGQDIYVGYHTTYGSGIKPLGTDEGPAEVNVGDVISQSGSQGYWYSLKTKFKIDQNWRISAILSTADQKLGAKAKDPAKAPAVISYNVYCDNMLVKDGITGTSFTVTDAQAGRYHVTAVTESGESAESNSVYYKTSGVETITADDAASDADAVFFNLQGVEVNRSNLTPGIYIRRSGSTAAKVIVK